MNSKLTRVLYKTIERNYEKAIKRNDIKGIRKYKKAYENLLQFLKVQEIERLEKLDGYNE